MNPISPSLALLGLLLLSTATATPVRSFSFTSFPASTTVDPINIVQDAALDGDYLQVVSTAPLSSGAAWYLQNVFVRGFQVDFTFSISTSDSGHDGFAFVIQSESDSSVGPFSGGLGYGDTDVVGKGITQSVAVEFDTYQNLDLGDPNGNHLSVHTLGALANSANETASLGRTESIPLLRNPTNPSNHTASVIYNPNLKQLQVWLDDGTGPYLTIQNFVLWQNITLAPNGMAWIGFTASTDTEGETVQIYQWSYQFLGYPVGYNSLATGLGLTNATAGATATFTVTSYDQFNFPYTSGGAELEVLITQSDNSQLNGTCVDLGTGVYECSYILFRIPTASLSVYLNGTHIKGSPFTISTVPGLVNPGNSRASGPGVEKFTSAGTVRQVTLTLFDSWMNQIDYYQPIVANVRVPAIPVQQGFTYQSAGAWTANYMVTLAGTFSLLIRVNQTIISNGNLSITVTPTSLDGSACTATGQGLVGGVVGTILNSTVQLRDRYSNPITVPSGATVIGKMTGPTTVLATSGYAGNGRFSLTCSTTVMGQYALAIEVNTEPVVQSPFSVSVSAGSPDPAQSVATGPALSHLYAGVTAQFALQLRDVYGNNFTSVANPNTYKIGMTVAGDNETNLACHFEAYGIWQCTFMLTDVAERTLSITVNGFGIVGSPFVVPMSAGPLSPMRSTLAGSGLTKTSTGDSAPIWVTARDNWGNLRVGYNDTFSLLFKDSHDVTTEADYTQKNYLNGTTYLSYEMGHMGTYNLTVLYQGQAIGQSSQSVEIVWKDLAMVVGLAGLGLVLGVALIFAICYWRFKLKKRRHYAEIREVNDHTEAQAS